MAGTTQEWSYVIKDNSDKNSSSRMYISDLAGAADGSIIYTDVTDLESVLADLTIGNIVRSKVAIPRATGLDEPPADVNAQNEIYMTVRYQDTVTNKKYYFSIPSPDPALRLPNSDDVDTTNSRWTDAVTTWEAAGVSELGNTIRILGAKFEGRSQR